MMHHYQNRERLDYYKLNQDIHSEIVRLADNETLANIHGNLQSRLKRIRFMGHEGPENWAKAVQEHVEMMDALSSRDSDRLVAVLDRHLLGAWERSKDFI